MIDIKQYGRIFGDISNAVQNNYGRYTRPWKYDDTKAAIVNARDLEFGCDPKYPVNLHEGLADIILRWCDDGYRDTGKEDLYNILIRLWKFTKRWLLIIQEHKTADIAAAMDKEATDQIADICGGNQKDYVVRTKRVTDLYTVTMMHLISLAVIEAEEQSGEEA